MIYYLPISINPASYMHYTAHTQSVANLQTEKLESWIQGIQFADSFEKNAIPSHSLE